MYDPTTVKKVIIDGQSLKIEDVVAVARLGAKVSLSPSARDAIECSRAVVEVLVSQKIVAYGINTGFGALRSYIIPEDKIVELQQNLIRSHACGVGAPFSHETVRAAMLLRANALARGQSGVRPNIILALLDMLNRGICPKVPCQGSVGASGDLAPLCHIALVLMGDAAGEFCVPTSQSDAVGTAVWKPARPENLKKHGFQPVVLSYKEGLALANGTQMMTAVATLTLYDAALLISSAEMALALSMEAMQSVTTSLDARIHQARPLEFQEQVAARLRRYVEQSTTLTSPLNGAVLWQALEYLTDAMANLTPKATALLPSLAKGKKAKDKNKPTAKNSHSHHHGDESGMAILQELQHDLHQMVQAEDDWVAGHPQAHPWHIAHDLESLKRVQGHIHKLQEKLASTMFQLPQTPVGKEVVHILQTTGKILEKAAPAMCPIQDDYSFRCATQVIACGWRAWQHAWQVVAQEINATTDNPLIFPPQQPAAATMPYRVWLEANPDLCRQAVCSGGNFHGEPVGMVMDYLKIALAEVGNISECRVAALVDVHRSQGLPPFLMKNPGLHSGLMIPQYTAAALVSENKILAHPATVDSIPTSGNAEDHVSMGTIAARHCAQVLENVRYVIAIELLTAHQGVYFRLTRSGKLARQLQDFFTQLRIQHPDQVEVGCGFFHEDRALGPIIQALVEAIAEGKLPSDVTAPHD